MCEGGGEVLQCALQSALPWDDPVGQAQRAKLGRQIFIAAVKRIVEFDIFAFYRGRHTYIGIDTLAFSSVETGGVLRSLVSGFEAGALRPFPIATGALYKLSDARMAFTAVLGSSRNRVVLAPAPEES